MPESDKPTLDLVSTPPELPKVETRPKRRRSLKIPDPEVFAKWVIETHDSEIKDRELRTQRRMARRNKLMGWHGPKNWPWKNAAQCFLPVMQIANLKVKGTIENALKSIRPMQEAKAKQKRNIEKEEKINQVLDYQFFIENQGEMNIDAFTTNFVEDEAVYALVQYVKEDQHYYDVRQLPAYDPAMDEISQRLMALSAMFPEMETQAMTDEKGFEWDVFFQDEYKKSRSGHVSFWDTEDGKVEASIVKSVSAFDGPSIRILDFDDVIFPARSANLQPPSSFNPEGAPWVDIRFRANLDTIRRRIEDGTYNLVTIDKDWESIFSGTSVAGSGDEGDQEKEQKDIHEGVELGFHKAREDRHGIMRFCRLDANGDGLEEDCIVWVLEDPELCLKVALLSEIYPGIPVRRPIAETSFIPISNRVLGISNSELTESLQDGMQMSLEQHLDWGTITNMPMFFYRAASGMKSEPIYIEPGVGTPLDDPQRDVAFPQWPTKDSTFSINTISLLQQFVEMVEMQSQASYGRVPTGKASAFRTTGTTVNLLSQSDSRAEQILRRAFGFMGDIFETMHRLNRRFLPEQKEIRTVGMAESGGDGYLTIDRNELNVDCDWEFKATLLNSNKQTLSQNLNQLMMLLFTPIAFQAGLIDQYGMYNVMRDMAKALEIDPDKYILRPPNPMPGPKLLAEEVVSKIIANEMPEGGPLEHPMEHFTKLQAFMMSDNFGFMNETQAHILANWMTKIQGIIVQQQMMIQKLSQFSGQEPQGEQGPGGVPTTGQPMGIAQNPPLRSGEKIDESVGVQ